jgi:hypothetical protein
VKKTPVIALLILAIVGWSHRADAGLADWMQGWSGPGPFNRRSLPITFGSLDQPSFDISAEHKLTSYIDFRRLRTDPEDNKFVIPVNATRLDFGISRSFLILRLQDSVQGGIGAVILGADGDRDRGGKQATRLTLTPARITIKPAVAITEAIFRYARRPKQEDQAEALRGALETLRKQADAIAAAIESATPTTPDSPSSNDRPQLNSAQVETELVKPDITLVNSLIAPDSQIVRLAEDGTLVRGDIDAAAQLRHIFGERDRPTLWYRLANSVKFQMTLSFIAGNLQAEDLGVSRFDSSYNEDWEPIFSRGFLVDFSELGVAGGRTLQLLWNKFKH